MKITPLLTALCVTLASSTSFATLADFAGSYKGTTLTTFTPTTPPTFNTDITLVVKPKGKGNEGTLNITSLSRVPGNAMTTIAAKFARNATGSAVVNNAESGVVNVSIPLSGKFGKKKFSLTSNFMLFNTFPTAVAMNLKVRGKKIVGLITYTMVETGEQVYVSNFTMKKARKK